MQTAIVTTGNTIQDFGQKIGGAKKDLAGQQLDRIRLITDDALMIQPLSKVFPRPDFQKMSRDGLITEDCAIRLQYLYNSIPAKPRSAYRSVRRWADSVMSIIGVIRAGLEGGSAFESQPFLQQEDFKNHEKELKAANWPTEDYSPHPFRIVHPHQFSSGNSYIVAKGNHIKFRSGNIEGCIDWIKEQSVTGKKNTEPEYSVRYFIRTKEHFITPKGKNNIVLKRGFEDVGTALAFIRDHSGELQATYDKIRFVPEERRGWNRPRVGCDHRATLDISPGQFSSVFPFRGVEFGNWLNQVDRSASLNDGYDALMDLALALEVAPSVLCLDNRLALAFGARGSGKASAHYEPLRQVINLTKTRGAGSLAHEWFHALDNYICIRKGSPLSYASDTAAGKCDDEILPAFRALRDAIKSSGFRIRSEKCDEYRSKPYWGTMIEMCARGFEKYIIARLHDLGWHNDYLANIRTMEEYGYDEKYPYPTNEEIKLLAPYYAAVIRHAFNSERSIDLRKTA
ncbi:hypothetical protein IR083_07720 [Dysgonomonas sp. GY75]|uniref:LPD5 domain-containing protein n=1 Tax=Dysgonomonas sp. GY75 TaxID=2780419 RepID=UPI0018836635|nr:LPD5 domain-containing protein [Dysgonomonas sp. GY75]MBF0648705.1 hypothetical protein [Dysgonomonas sp. GY75]